MKNITEEYLKDMFNIMLLLKKAIKLYDAGKMFDLKNILHFAVGACSANIEYKFDDLLPDDERTQNNGFLRGDNK